MSPANGTDASPSAVSTSSSSPTKRTPAPKPRPRKTGVGALTSSVNDPASSPSTTTHATTAASSAPAPSASASAKLKATTAPSSSFSSVSTSSSSSSPTKPVRPVKVKRPWMPIARKEAPRPSSSSAIGAWSPPTGQQTNRKTARRSTRGTGTSEPLFQLGSPSRDHKPAVRVQAKPTPPLDDSAMSVSSISTGGFNPPGLAATSTVDFGNTGATPTTTTAATPVFATSTSALATPTTATSPTTLSSAAPSTMAGTIGVGVLGGTGGIDGVDPWKHPDELEYICRQDWTQDRMITYLCHHAFSILPREGPLPILNPDLLSPAPTDADGGVDGSTTTTTYQHNLYQTLGAAAIAGGAAIGNTKTKSKPNPFVGVVLREPGAGYSDSYTSPPNGNTTNTASTNTTTNDTANAKDDQQPRSTVIYLPRGYRVPLMFVGKFQWESLRLVLTSGSPDSEWEEFKFDIVHLSRLCSHLLRSAERVCKEDLVSSSGGGVGVGSPSIGGSVNGSSPAIGGLGVGGGGTPSALGGTSAAASKSQAKQEPRIGAMDRHWRCPMFDRALVRFYRKWMVCREWSLKLFWEEFGEEEYGFDVLKHDWARWVLKGHKGFLCTKEEVEGGITADQYTAGLDRTDEGKWVWDNEKYVQSRNGIALVGQTTTGSGSVNTAAATAKAKNGTTQNANGNAAAMVPDVVLVSSATVAPKPQGDIGLKVKREVVEAVIPPPLNGQAKSSGGSISASGMTGTTSTSTSGVTTTGISSATTPIVPIMGSTMSAPTAKPIVVLSRTASQSSNAATTSTTTTTTPTPTSATTATTTTTAAAPSKTANGVSTANGSVPAQVAGKKRARTEDEEAPVVQRSASVSQKAGGEAQSKENGKEAEKERDESERKRVKVMDQEKDKEEAKEKEGVAKAPSPGSVSKPQQVLPTPPLTSTSTTSTTFASQKQPTATTTTTTGPVKHTQAILEYLGHRIVIRRDQNGKGCVEDLSKVPFVKGATLKFSAASDDPSDGKETEKEKEAEKEKGNKGKGWTFSWEEEIRAPLLPSAPVATPFMNPARWTGEWRPPYIKFVPGDTWGLVGFHRAISEEEQRYVSNRVSTIGGKRVEWTLLSEEEERAFQIERAQVAARAAFVQLDESLAAAAATTSTTAPTPASSTNNATTTTASSNSASTASKATAPSSTTKVPTPPKEKDENAMDVDEDGDVAMRPASGKDTVVQESLPSVPSAPVNEATTSTTAAQEMSVEKHVDPKVPASTEPRVERQKTFDGFSEILTELEDDSEEDDYDDNEDESEADEGGAGVAASEKVASAEEEKSEEEEEVNTQKVRPRSSTFFIKKPLYSKPTGKLNPTPPPPPKSYSPPYAKSSSSSSSSPKPTIQLAQVSPVRKRKSSDMGAPPYILEQFLSKKLEDAVKAITEKIREELEEARESDKASFAEQRKKDAKERKKEVEDIRQVVEEVKLQLIEFQQRNQSQVLVKNESRQTQFPLPPETAKILEALLGLLEGNKRLTNLVTSSKEDVEEILVSVVDLVAEVCKDSKKFGEEQRNVREEVDRRMGDVVRGVEDVVNEVVATKSIVVDRRNENENQRAVDEVERAEREKRVVDEVEKRMEGRFGMVMEGIWRLDKELGRERERRREWEEEVVLRRQRDGEERPRVSRVESGSGSGSGVSAVEVIDVGIQAEDVGDEDRALVKRRRLDTDVTMVDLHERHHQEESASTASAMKHSNPSKAKKVLDVMRNMADILELTTYDEEQVSANLVERHQTVSAKGKERQRDPDLWVETRSESTLLSLLLDEFKLIKDQLRASERRGREEIAALRLLHSAEMEKLRDDLSRDREGDGGGTAGLRDAASFGMDEARWGRDRERDRDRKQKDDYTSEGGVNAEILDLRKRLAQLESRGLHSQQPPPMSASVSGSTPEPHRRERSSSIASSSNFEPRVPNGNGVAGGSANVRGGGDWNRRAGSAANGYTSAGPSRRPSVSLADVDLDSPSVPLPVKTQRKLMRGMPPPD